jgi:(1->4)-alpha-D-glucan 1-alpha-D-glucosylmutase
LLGAWPLLEEELPEFKERLKAYVIKAVREAKVHTRWIAPDPEHENALLAFVEAILEDTPDNAFLQDFRKFQARLAYYGALQSLSQVLLKITSPGVPDFYQGTELWDFSLVDPDNRRPVDFQERARRLRDLKRRDAKNPGALLREMLHHWQRGSIKLYLTYKALNFRKAHLDLFLEGDYLPLAAVGPRGKNVVAFARRRKNLWVVVVAARLVSKILAAGKPYGDQEGWRGNFLNLPPEAPGEWLNILTGEKIKTQPQQRTRSLPLHHLLGNLPVALLCGRVA